MPLLSSKHNPQAVDDSVPVSLRKQLFSSRGQELQDFYCTFDKKLGQSFRSLLERNKSYIEEISKGCCKKQKIGSKFDFQIKPPYSTYEHEFPPKQQGQIPPFKVTDNLQLAVGSLPVSTTNQQSYSGRKGIPATLLRPQDAAEFCGPPQTVTSYKHNFPVWGRVKPQPTPVREQLTPRGLPLKGKSIYQDCFRGKGTDRPSSAKRPDFKHGGFKVPMQSSYQKEMQHKQRGRLRSQHPKEIRLAREGLFSTTHREHFGAPEESPEWPLNKCYRVQTQ